jgi:hypothetical protein
MRETSTVTPNTQCAACAFTARSTTLALASSALLTTLRLCDGKQTPETR